MYGQREPMVVYSCSSESSDITEQLRIDSVNPGGTWVKLFFIGKGKEKDCVRASCRQSPVGRRKKGWEGDGAWDHPRLTAPVAGWAGARISSRRDWIFSPPNHTLYPSDGQKNLCWGALCLFLCKCSSQLKPQLPQRSCELILCH